MAIPLRLKIYRGDEFVESREFERGMIKVGRVASAHLCIDDEKITRIHLVINAETAEQLSVVDMGGVEGTFVNGKRVSKANLTFGDEIRLGGTRIIVEDGSVPETVAPAPGEVAEAVSQEPASEAAEVSDTPSLQDALASIPGIASQEAPAAPATGDDVSAAVAAASVNLFSGGSQRQQTPSKKNFGSYVPTAPVPRYPRARKGRLGLNVRYYWGDTLLEVYQMKSPADAFIGCIYGKDGQLQGSRRNADKLQFEFLPSELDGRTLHRFISDDGSGNFCIHLTGSMRGSVVPENGEVRPLSPGQGVTLRDTDFAWVDVGRIRVEFSFEQQPKPIIIPWYVGLDFGFLAKVGALLFAMGLFVISASTHTEVDIIADDIGESQLKMVKAFIQEAEKPKKNPLLEKLQKSAKKKEAQPQGGEMAERHKGQEGKMGRKDMAPNKNKRSAPKAIDINAKDLVKHSGGLVSVLGGGGGGGGLATIFGQGGLGGDIKGAIGNMHGPQVGNAGGFGGLGLRGTGTGGGGSGNTIGIGGIGTKGRGGGLGGYGAGVGGLGGKKKSDVAISDGESTIQGALDKELIRQVIQSNMGQIRYCYEKELQRKPDLAGKVVVRFEIAANGSVPSAKVHAGTTLKDAALGDCITVRIRNWRFPEPKGGGKVTVTYPFVFKPAGD